MIAAITEVEVVVTAQVTELAGTVVDDRNRRVGDAAVIAFAQDRALWYPGGRFVAAADTARDGTFSIPALGPGPRSGLLPAHDGRRRAR